MDNIVEKTDAIVDITTDAAEGSPIVVYAVGYGKSPDDKIELATYTAPAANEAKEIRLETSGLEMDTYHIEVWSNFGTDDQHRRITTRITIENSRVI